MKLFNKRVKENTSPPYCERLNKSLALKCIAVGLCVAVILSTTPASAAVNDNLDSLETQILLLENQISSFLGLGKISTYPASKTAYNTASLVEKVNYLEQQNEKLEEKIASLEVSIGSADTKTYSTASSWAEIQSICQQGKAKERFTVGEARKVNFAPAGAPNQDVTITITNIASDGKSITCMVTKYDTAAPTYQMNSSNTNSGSWSASAMRSWLNSTYYNSLPADLRSVIASTTVITGAYQNGSNTTTTDKLFLPAEKEIGLSTLSSINEKNALSTWSYFGDSGRRMMYSGSSDSAWWLRSPGTGWNYYFCSVDGGGSVKNDYATVKYSVFPAFTIK